MQKPIMTGHTISLRIPVMDDVFVRGWDGWYNDQDVTRFNSHGVFPVSKEQEWEIVKAEMDNPTSILLAIWETKGDRLLGNICLQSVDFVNRTARLAVTIGEAAPPTACVEAFGLMTNHAFMRLNLNRIFEATHANLINFIKSIGIFGFQVEGRGREHFLKDGLAGDIIYYGTNKTDFLERLRLRDNQLLFSNKVELLAAIRSGMNK